VVRLRSHLDPGGLFAGMPDFMRIRSVYDQHGILSRREGDSREVGGFAFTSAVDLTMRNTRRYGGYIVHMGMVLVFIGLAEQPSIAIHRRKCNLAPQCKSGRTR